MFPFVAKQKKLCKTLNCLLVIAGGLLCSSERLIAQDPWKNLESKPATLGLEKGLLSFKTPAFRLQLVKASQTVATLQSNVDTVFDFTPHDRLKLRSGNHMYHLGDLNIRLREQGQTGWKSYSTASGRQEVSPISTGGKNVLAAADLTNTLPDGMPIRVERYWELVDGQLVLLFKLKNISNRVVELGSLGIPMIFNNILQGKTLEDAHATNVFYDPYIGKDAGYLQVTRLNGHGPVLLVLPFNKTPFEAYNPLLDDPTPRGIDFEGFYEWMVHSKAYAENDWSKAEPWNKPTAVSLNPGGTTEYGVKFILAASPQDIEPTLKVNNRPVAIGIPGYVLPMDVDAKLFLSYSKKVSALQVEPQGALTVKAVADGNATHQLYQVRGKIWGRARLTITYQDGLIQTVNYKVIKPEAEVLKDYGHFLTHEQWFENQSDPFGRDQSVISYDYESKKQVTQDSRAWIPGLSDEGGAGGWLGAVMKEVVQPDKAEIARLQVFVGHTMWGNIQHNEGEQKYGVKKSVFYYQPNEMPPGTYSDTINYKTWAAWDRKAANDVGRSYNYPHVAAAHWALYRLARYHTGLVTDKPWAWYLQNAFHTSMAMVQLAPYYAQYGQMEGTVFYLILMDLKAEGWQKEANELELAMKARADHWRTLLYPFGSEMPWDSTGQEEVYLWSDYFGYADKAATTINAIFAYMPTIPHWGYNGSARRYWDFLYGGKLSRIERQLHHYGSGLNAIPVLSAYRKKLGDLYMLRVGYGGLMGSIANITPDGFGPAAFHSFPSTLKIDGLSGDYGSNFFGYAVNSAVYLTHDADLGWLAFGGNLTQSGPWVNVAITNGSRSKIYIAPAALWLTLKAGTFSKIAYNTTTKKILVWLDRKYDDTPVAYLDVSQSPVKTGSYTVEKNIAKKRGAYVIPLLNGLRQVTLSPSAD
ncbi:DUF5695 domain-containing protein [Mucilaginibacter paludis]|uniref:Uncharacterized protein n=1 Tax=Mucilaginibacter paludis DSM 18603 TaxID=714943 RepID=H1Y873_9SPHI|nr:DUF5695 domain-containing protein [Mucilaginibacter paludis]EHQ31095.1 hypothetical protein Mucpa_7051 [Mucilaginibacter paludis DSM 18603]